MVDIPTELELAEEHLKVAQTLLKLRLAQESYDRIFGVGEYAKSLEELRSSLAPIPATNS